MARHPKDRATLYREKAETSRTIAEAMRNESARTTVLDVAAMWDSLADEEEKKAKREKGCSHTPHA
jgi:hypothetical protein